MKPDRSVSVKYELAGRKISSSIDILSRSDIESLLFMMESDRLNIFRYVYNT